MDDHAPFLRRREVARLLKISPSTVSRLVARGDLEAFRIGGRVGRLRISTRSVEEFTGVPLEPPQVVQPTE